MTTTELRLQAIELGRSSTDPWTKAFALWLAQARPDQLAPAGAWLVWFLMGGRGAGKTRTGAQHVTRRLMRDGYRRWGCIARTAHHIRDEVVEGPAGLLACAPPNARPRYEPSKLRVVYPNGAIAFLYSAEEPDALRGPEHDGLWCVAPGTEVLTNRGRTPIEYVTLWDWVWTRQGWNRIRWVSPSGTRVERVRLGSLVLTPDHHIWTENEGWKYAADVRLQDTIAVWNYDQDHQHGSTGTTSGGIETGLATIRMPVEPYCIGRCGSESTADTARQSWTSTTEMASRRTTSLGTLRLCPLGSIDPITTGRSLAAAWRGRPRIEAEPPWSRGRTGSRGESPVITAVRSMGRRGNVPGSAPAGAPQLIAGVRVESATWGPVYDLSVEDCPEFYANGILVHNCDELASWKDAHKGDVVDTTWNNAMLGLRRGTRPEVVITSTPKRVKLVRELVKRRSTVIVNASTYANLANLTPVFRQEILSTYEGTRLGRQELMGELLEDVEGALWNEPDILRAEIPADLTRIGIAVDPSGTTTGDEIGILAGGRIGNRGYVLADASGHYSPEGWGRRVVGLYHDLRADQVVAEGNFGGDMVVHVIRTVDPSVPVKVLHASRGKLVRAEPVAAMYEQHRWFHCGVFPLLEEEMLTWTPDDPKSPNRLDALVWLVTELMLEKPRARLRYTA